MKHYYACFAIVNDRTYETEFTGRVIEDEHPLQYLLKAKRDSQDMYNKNLIEDKQTITLVSWNEISEKEYLTFRSMGL